MNDVKPVPPDVVPMAVDAVTVVNAPLDAVVAPMVIPLIVPPVSVAPLEESVFSVAVEDAPSVVKEPAAGVTLPIMPCKDVAVATPRVGVTNVGEVDITTLPVPVMALLTRPLEASVNTALLAVRLDRMGCAVNVATPVTANVPPMLPLPAKNKSLNFNAELPMSTVFVVFGANKVDDVYLAETWLVKDAEKDKATLYGFSPVVGEWYGIYKVGNGRVWNEYVKTGKVRGFSVEGYFYNNVLTKK